MAKDFNLDKKAFSIKWLLADKQMVKFNEEDETYDLADNVIQYIKNISKGDAVEVLIEKGTTNIVCMKKVGGTKKKTVKKEIKEESLPSEGEEKTWTVKAITTDRKVVKFAESDAPWYLIIPEVKDCFTNVKAKDVLKVKIGTAKEKGKDKPAVVGVVEEHKEKISTDPSLDTYEPIEGQTKSNTNNSIERQVALKEAGAIVRALIEHANLTDINEIKKTLVEFNKIAIESLNQ